MAFENQSWGRFPHAQQGAIALSGRHTGLPTFEGFALPYGNGRSYGDSCLNPGNYLLLTRGLDRFIAFDPDTGVLRCEAGVTLAEILDLIVPHGWFLPVTPGTRYVTVGGAIANDVHGKNHHRAGSFGNHVTRLELQRSDGERINCTSGDASDWFAATLGGLGLTGLITWAEMRLRRIVGPWLKSECIRFDNLDEFFQLSLESVKTHEYTVAWVDCLSQGKALGRGHFLRADHVPVAIEERPEPSKSQLSMVFTPPFSLVNRFSLRPFNALYYHRQRSRRRRSTVHYSPYFYPLDGIRNWNRIYGPRGFLQHQSVLPPATAHGATAALLREISSSGTGSFLAVLKEFGDRPSLGMMSFPRPGTTLALDFPNSGPAVFALLDRLDAIVAEAGGAVYPAKDARMSGTMFRQGFPRWEAFQAYIDPRFSSGFWRRVTEETCNMS